MRSTRLLLVCLLALAIGVQGPALAHASAHACAVEHEIQAQTTPAAMAVQGHGAHGSETGGAHADLSPAAAGHDADSDACACAQGCHTVHSLPLVARAPAARVMSAERVPVADAQAFDSRRAFSHWRPPALT